MKANQIAEALEYMKCGLVFKESRFEFIKLKNKLSSNGTKSKDRRRPR